MALGSYIENHNDNEVIIMKVTGDHIEFKLKFPHHYPATKLRWYSEELILSSGTYMQLFKYDANELKVTRTHEFTPTSANFFKGPQLNFDYHELAKQKVGTQIHLN